MLYIVTLNWNGADLLPTIIDSAIPCLTNHPYKWIIRDNGSHDDSIKILNEYASRYPIEIVSMHHNRDNFATGINYCVNHVANPHDADLILLLNNDLKFLDTVSISKMIKCLKPNVGMVGARMIYPNGTLQHAGVIFGPRYGNLPYHFRHKEPDDKFSRMNREFQAITAACMLMRADSFKSIHQNDPVNAGFDEGYHWCFEDTDACFAVRNSGKSIIYCGETNIEHQESHTLKRNPVNKLFMQHNVKRFKNKWWGKYKIDHDNYLKDKMHNVIK